MFFFCCSFVSDRFVSTVYIFTRDSLGGESQIRLRRSSRISKSVEEVSEVVDLTGTAANSRYVLFSRV